MISLDFRRHVIEFFARLFAAQAGAGTVVDRRVVPRRIYMQDGYLTFPQRPAYPATICLIRDLSPAGAQIELTEPVDEDVLVHGMRLYIARKMHERECHIAWRDKSLMGLKFTGPPLSATRDYRHPTQRGR